MQAADAYQAVRLKGKSLGGCPLLGARSTLATVLAGFAVAKWAFPSAGSVYQVAAVAEVGLAATLLLRPGRGVLLLAAVTFAGFAAASLYRLVSGATCGCLGSGVKPSNAVLLPACGLIAMACVLLHRAAGGATSAPGKIAYAALAVGVLGLPLAAALGRAPAPSGTPEGLSALVARSGLTSGNILVVQHDCGHCRALLDALSNLAAGPGGAGVAGCVVVAELPPYAAEREAAVLFPSNVRRIHCPNGLRLLCFPSMVPVSDSTAGEARCLSGPQDLLSLIPRRSTR